MDCITTNASYPIVLSQPPSTLKYLYHPSPTSTRNCLGISFPFILPQHLPPLHLVSSLPLIPPFPSSHSSLIPPFSHLYYSQGYAEGATEKKNSLFNFRRSFKSARPSTLASGGTGGSGGGYPPLGITHSSHHSYRLHRQGSGSGGGEVGPGAGGGGGSSGGGGGYLAEGIIPGWESTRTVAAEKTMEELTLLQRCIVGMITSISGDTNGNHRRRSNSNNNNNNHNNNHNNHSIIALYNRRYDLSNIIQQRLVLLLEEQLRSFTRLTSTPIHHGLSHHHHNEPSRSGSILLGNKYNLGALTGLTSSTTQSDKGEIEGFTVTMLMMSSYLRTTQVVIHDAFFSYILSLQPLHTSLFLKPFLASIESIHCMHFSIQPLIRKYILLLKRAFSILSMHSFFHWNLLPFINLSLPMQPITSYDHLSLLSPPPPPPLHDDMRCTSILWVCFPSVTHPSRRCR